MATVTRVYYIGSSVTLAQLKRYAGSSALEVDPTGARSYVGIKCDDSVLNYAQDVDDYMATRGYKFFAEDPNPAPFFSLRSPNGTQWRLQISDLGVLTISPLL